MGMAGWPKHFGPQALLPPNTFSSVYCGMSFFSGPKTRGGGVETNIGHLEKQVVGRLGQATVGTQALAQQATTVLPTSSLLQEPHPCACVH